MDQDELFRSMAAARPDSDDLVYLERSGREYSWHVVTGGAPMTSPRTGTGSPDVWIFLSREWPLDDPAAFRAFFDDLLAEMESMAGGDRCRWPLDEPWPRGH